MRVISVNVGLPRKVVWKGKTVQTGIFKTPVEGPVSVSKLNLAGDKQADLSVHGGLAKAVYACPAEHYEYWRKQLPDVSFSWGNFGENLTTEGLSEGTLCIGDCVKVGSAVLTVTQPRMPCYKLSLRFGRDDMNERFLESRRSGIYFSVFEEGEVAAGSRVEIVSRDPQKVSIADLLSLYLDEHNQELVERALRVNALPEKWKLALQRRAQGTRA